MITGDVTRNWLAVTGIISDQNRVEHLRECGIDHGLSTAVEFSHADAFAARAAAHLTCTCGRVRNLMVGRTVKDLTALVNEFGEFFVPLPPVAPAPVPLPDGPLPPVRLAPPSRQTHAPAPPSRQHPRPRRPRAERALVAVAAAPASPPATVPVPAAAPAAAKPGKRPGAGAKPQRPFEVSEHRETPVPSYAAQRRQHPRRIPMGVCSYCGNFEKMRSDNSIGKHKFGTSNCSGMYQETANLIPDA